MAATAASVHGIRHDGVQFLRSSGRIGVGRMRVVDECRLHHVALLERTATLRPIYTGARCYGAKHSGPGCPMHLRESAEAWAFRQIAVQAAVR
jgi:hypothetical protein